MQPVRLGIVYGVNFLSLKEQALGNDAFLSRAVKKGLACFVSSVLIHKYRGFVTGIKKPRLAGLGGL